MAPWLVSADAGGAKAHSVGTTALSNELCQMRPFTTLSECSPEQKGQWGLSERGLGFQDMQTTFAPGWSSGTCRVISMALPHDISVSNRRVAEANLMGTVKVPVPQHDIFGLTKKYSQHQHPAILAHSRDLILKSLAPHGTLPLEGLWKQAGTTWPKRTCGAHWLHSCQSS